MSRFNFSSSKSSKKGDRKQNRRAIEGSSHPRSPHLQETPPRSPRQHPLLLRIASHLIKSYFAIVVGFGMALWIAVVFKATVAPNFVESIVDALWRGLILLGLFLGIVSVNQSVR